MAPNHHGIGSRINCELSLPTWVAAADNGGPTFRSNEYIPNLCLDSATLYTFAVHDLDCLSTPEYRRSRYR
jgi:hypothetical protein